jgi:hypothetical protein
MSNTNSHCGERNPNADGNADTDGVRTDADTDGVRTDPDADTDGVRTDPDADIVTKTNAKRGTLKGGISCSIPPVSVPKPCLIVLIVSPCLELPQYVTRRTRIMPACCAAYAMLHRRVEVAIMVPVLRPLH